MAYLYGRVVVLVLLFLNTISSAHVLVPRQEDASTTDAPENEATATSSSQSDSSTTGTETASSGTATAESTSSSHTTVPTHIGTPLNATNDPNKCHKDRNETNVFCKPVTGQKLDYDAAYIVSWDPLRNEANSSNIVEIYATSFLEETTEGWPLIQHSALYRSPNVPNANGETTIETSKAWLNGTKLANLTMRLAVTPPPEKGAPESKLGPFILLMDTAGSNSTSPSSESHNKKLGEKVGIPVGLILVLIVIAGLAFFFIRRRRRNADYLSRKSHTQRTQSGGAGGLVGPLDRSHRRTESFHDEPTRGVELQERHGDRGGSDWGWGSPTSPTRGNVFREEIGRQETGKAI
ncbi:uncharacterized protein KY384_004267 [Bacidia gigantensis]|uniref:uncharacterized protein n=1 Tax=Bacidia gigantensis TaxID=2732470 RepID=UPI001D0433CA|nr:uncharacterized protein KY384_004267 [Bacidia gigantensis]KAG8530910.1 hypothetical protein KY384_004267 [Bacidia gigantensis]